MKNENFREEIEIYLQQIKSFILEAQKNINNNSFINSCLPSIKELEKKVEIDSLKQKLNKFKGILKERFYF